MKLILLFFCLNIAFTKIINSKFSEIIYSRGINEYTYQISNFIQKSEKIEYLLFRFPQKKYISFEIILDNLNKTKIDVDTNQWMKFPIKNMNKSDFNITFILINNMNINNKFLFLHISSRDIFIDLNVFLSLNLTINDLKDEPYPIIFNINVIKFDTLIKFNSSNLSFNEIIDNNLYNKSNLLYYCLVKENDCEYININSSEIYLMKGEKYKFKLNTYLNVNKTYNFKNLEVLNLFKYIDFGVTDYIMGMNIKSQYYIFNKKNFQDLYLYITSLSYIYVNYFNEEEKIDYIKNIDNYTNNFIEKNIFNELVELELKNIKKDYLIIKFQNIRPSYYYYNCFQFFRGILFIGNYLFKLNYDISFKFGYEFDLKKGNHSLFVNDNLANNYILSSSKNNVIELNSLDLNNFKIIKSYYTFLMNHKHQYIYINSSEENTKLIFYKTGLTTIKEDIQYFYLSNDRALNYLINKRQNLNSYDSLFNRRITMYYNIGFYSQYFFDIKQKYYFFYRKYFGGMNIYEYNQKLDVHTNITNFYGLIKNYKDEKCKIVNNNLIVIEEFKLINIFINSNSLFDFYLQKVDDFEYINFNNEFSKNLVKILNPNKIYYLNFTLDHLIKLDYNFIYSTVIFTDDNGVDYILNKSQKILKNLKGDNIKVRSTQIALLYFYKKIESNVSYEALEFDKSKKNKNLQFKLTFKEFTKIKILKDFGFRGYYPMGDKDLSIPFYFSSEKTKNIYIENYYDLIIDKNNIYENEGEGYFIYLCKTYLDEGIKFLSPESYNITDINYFESIPIKNSDYNFQIIEPNSNGSLFLYTLNKNKIKYQFFKCKNTKINFKLFNYFIKIYPYNELNYNKNIYSNKEIIFDLNEEENLIHKFENSEEFLFSYSLYNIKDEYDNKRKSIIKKNKDNFIYINQLSKTKLEIIFNYKFSSEYYTLTTKFYIIISKINKVNNIFSFNNECHLTKLILNNDKNIFIKQIYKEQNFIIKDILDISDLNPNDNDKFVINIISHMLEYDYSLDFFSPKEFILGQNDAIEFYLGEKINFNFRNNNYFKFQHAENKDTIIYFYFTCDKKFYLLFSKEGEKIKDFEFKNPNNNFKINITESGYYYIYLYSDDIEVEKNNYDFYTYIPEGLIENIDLKKNMYISEIRMKFMEYIKPNYYKVNNLKKDVYVYFNYKFEYDNVKHPEHINFTNPFKICKNINDECVTDIKLFKFLKNHEYTMYINLIRTKVKLPFYNSYIPTYIFFPIFENTIEDIKEGTYSFSTPKIFNFDLKNKDEISLFFKKNSKENNTLYYYQFQDEKVNIYNLASIIWEKGNNNDNIKTFNNFKNKYLILFIYPKINNYPIEILLFQKIKNEISKNYLIEGGKSFLFYLDNKNRINNILTIFSSPINNMIIINSNNNYKEYNYIIQNSLPIPIFVEKNSKDINIKVNTYKSNIVFFSVINEDFLKIQINLIKELLNSYNIFIEEKNPLHFRIKTDMNIFYKIFNLYFFDLETNIIIYIKKLFGDSEIYECENEINGNYELLTKPLLYCKNKKSIFNRIININNKKLISGNLDFDTYLDIFIEIEKYSTEINLSNIIVDNLKYNHGAKYLKKNIEYTLNFELNHLIKIESGFNAQVYIYNEDSFSVILNSTNLIFDFDEYNKNNYLEDNFENLKIKSDNDIIIYFNEKFDSEVNIYQIKIDATEKRKNIALSNIHSFNYDINFENIKTLNIFNTKFIENYGENIFLENIYERLNEKLNKNEYFYIYSYNNRNLQVEYSSINLNDHNNYYDFLKINSNKKSSINNNEQKYSLIINNEYYKKIIFQIYYCKYNPSNIVEMKYQSSNSQESEYSLDFLRGIYELEENIPIGTIKLRFYSDNDFIFNYAFIKFDDFSINNRKELTDLKINEIKNDNNLLSINFNPNYRNSLTLYILIIAPYNENYTLDNFKDKCFITKLATEKNNDTKIINIYNIGENETINIEINISEIYNPTNEYIINIISKELRYSHNLKFYEPKIFIYENQINVLKIIIIIILIIFGVLIILLLYIYVRRVTKKEKRNKVIDYKRQIDSIDHNRFIREME